MKYLMLALCAVLCAFTLTSCPSLKLSPDAPSTVITTEQHVQPGVSAIDTGIKAKDEAGGDVRVVIVPETSLITPTAPHVKIDTKAGDQTEEITGFLTNVKTGTPIDEYLPIIAMILGSLMGGKLALSPRARGHAVTAAKQLFTGHPLNAATALAKADGWIHSDHQPKILQDTNNA